MSKNSSPLTMLPFGYQGKVFRSPMPYGPFDRLSQTWQAYQEQSISVVVVLTDNKEFLAHAGLDLPAFYRKENIEAIHIPIPDFGIPGDKDAFWSAIKFADKYARAGKNIAIHCLAGIGRTGLFMACLAKHHLGLSGKDAIDWVRKFIPGALENLSQEKYVIDF
ncbi:MAG: dual specificity protein phosphatase family protein [Chloroflexi bacterium]|nr:dual specificity protein phosphatase family protein [Chloroflexota bacterium]